MTLMKHRKYYRLLTEVLLSFDITKPFTTAYLRSLILGIVAYGKSLISKRRSVSQVPRDTSSKTITKLAQRPLYDLPAILEMDTSITSLPALLRYEDKNSMWHSIEARVPFLHRSFFEYVALLPLDRKLRSGWTKYSFRAAMKGILPEKVRLRRSKIGFETPQKRWIEKELRNELEEFFSDPNLRAMEYYNAGTLRNLLNRHALTNNETDFIWRVLNLELWYREFFTEKLKS